MEYGADKGAEEISTGEHPVRRGILQDIDEMEKLVDNLFNFELAAYAGAHTPVRSRVGYLTYRYLPLRYGRYCVVQMKTLTIWHLL